MQVIKIGRNQGNDIVFADQTVSGSHADIYINDDGSLQIVDHSSNGTYVNQTFIRKYYRKRAKARILALSVTLR